MASAALQQETQSLFQNAHNTIITDGQFANVIHVHQATNIGKESFERLVQNAAPCAFHNSAQRIDPPRCHENTRKAVLDSLFNWISLDAARTSKFIAWLNGAAGAGKSAICQSLAEMCIMRGIFVASFFFFRADPLRNTVRPLAATLAYQLIQLIPESKEIILQVIACNPLIFEQSLDAQIDNLLIQPLRQLQIPFKFLLVIDGVDECTGESNQTDIVRTLTKYAADPGSPIIVLFGSRAENQLQMAFRKPQTAKTLLPVPLDNNYVPEKDIRLLLDAKLGEIKETHPFNYLLPAEWPAPSAVQEIVNKASGQFIYASVVINFVSLPYANPAKQLELVRGLRPAGLATPFAELDALYMHILSTVRDLETVTKCLAYTIFGRRNYIDHAAAFFNIPPEDIHIAFAELTSVISCARNRFTFLHASLPDFLLDKARSGCYHIDPHIWANSLCSLWFEKAATRQWEGGCDLSIEFVTLHASPTGSLRSSILKFDVESCQAMMDSFKPSYGIPAIMWGAYFRNYLVAVKALDFGDNGYTYQKQLNVITRVLIHNPEYIKHLQQKHDIQHIIAEIEREKTSSTSTRQSEKTVEVVHTVQHGKALTRQIHEARQLPSEGKGKKGAKKLSFASFFRKECK